MHDALNFDDISLSLNIIAISKWILPLESVEKVVSKSERRKLFQLGLSYHSEDVIFVPFSEKFTCTAIVNIGFTILGFQTKWVELVESEIILFRLYRRIFETLENW